MREPERRFTRTDRDGIARADDRHDRAAIGHGRADRDAVTDSDSLPVTDGIVDSGADQRPRKRDREPFACRGGQSCGDGAGQRDQLLALRDADRYRLPRSAVALPLARRPAPLDPADLHEPRGQQRTRLDEVVEEMQVRSRDRKTAKEQAA